ncbi:MAG: hypothetical protein RL625_333 [Gemmatimonadota bacterium]|jgi:hypothetical protein
MRPDRPLSDAELEALLRALPREAPTTGFADRVMAQVRLPAAAVAPARVRIPWRALLGVLTLDLALAAALLIGFGDELLRVLVGSVHGLAKLAVGLGSFDLGTAWEPILTRLLSSGAFVPSATTLSTLLLLGATGALLAIATLGRLARGAAPSSR